MKQRFEDVVVFPIRIVTEAKLRIRLAHLVEERSGLIPQGRGGLGVAVWMELLGERHVGGPEARRARVPGNIEDQCKLFEAACAKSILVARRAMLLYYVIILLFLLYYIIL